MAKVKLVNKFLRLDCNDGKELSNCNIHIRKYSNNVFHIEIFSQSSKLIEKKNCSQS